MFAIFKSQRKNSLLSINTTICWFFPYIWRVVKNSPCVWINWNFSKANEHWKIRYLCQHPKIYDRWTQNFTWYYLPHTKKISANSDIHDDTPLKYHYWYREDIHNNLINVKLINFDNYGEQSSDRY